MHSGRAKRALSRGVDGKFHQAVHAHIWYIYVPYVHNPESARKILRTRLVLENLDTLDSSMIRKWLQFLRPKERNLDLHAAYLMAVRKRMLEFYSD